MSSNPFQKELDWHNLYKGETSRDCLLFTQASTAHPAKLSLPLQSKIFATMQAWGWLRMGGEVVVTEELQAEIIAELQNAYPGVYNNDGTRTQG